MPPVIAAPVTAALVGLGVGAATAGVIGSAVGSLVFAGGLAIVGQALQSKPRGTSLGAQLTNSPEVRGSVKQAAPAQRIVFGETRFGGALSFYKAAAPFLYLQQLHSAMPITSFDRLFAGEVEVPLDANGLPIAAPYLVGASTARLEVATQDGSSLAQLINSILASGFASLDADFRLPGIAASVFKCDYGASFDEFQTLWGQVQIPDFQWIGKGAPIYDPRDPTQILPTDVNDPTDLWNAIATWKYTNNAALIQAFWAMMPFGLNAGPDRIRWDEVATAADFDDESIPVKAGGVVKRHTIDGVVSLDQNPLGVMEDMLTANRGFISPRGGSVTVSSSQPRSPRMTIVDDMILAGFTYRDARPKRDLANIVRGKFVSSERNHQESDAPERRRPDLITADGEELSVSINMPLTGRHETAQRLMKAELETTRNGRAVAGTFDMRALGLVEGEICNVWSELFPDMNGTYEVLEWGLTDDLQGVSLSLAQYDATLSRNWTRDTDEADFTIEVETV